MRDADHEESAPDAPTLVITRLVCSLRGTEQDVRVLPGTLASKAYGKDRSTEQFRCNYGLNERYLDVLFEGDLKVAGKDSEGNVRIVELQSHPFFVATLFVPQLSSEPGKPHPLVVAFVEAARAFRASQQPAGRPGPQRIESEHQPERTVRGVSGGQSRWTF
jgi:CTP synthase (UTP-ammonia lyase)